MILTTKEQLCLVLGDFLAKAKGSENTEDLKKLIEQKAAEVMRVQAGSDLLLSERDVNKRYPAFTRSYLQMLRFRNSGPRYYKMHAGQNGRVYYKISDIEVWLRGHRVVPNN